MTGRPDLATASDAQIRSFQTSKEFAAAAASRQVLSVVWKDTYYSGGSFTFYTGGTNNPCTVSGTYYRQLTMPDGWDDTISSIRAVVNSGCLHQRYWAASGLNGNSANYDTNGGQNWSYPDLGSYWNDRISSIDWYR